jgi:hypothetical protein
MKGPIHSFPRKKINSQKLITPFHPLSQKIRERRSIVTSNPSEQQHCPDEAITQQSTQTLKLGYKSKTKSQQQGAILRFSANFYL